MKAAKVALDVVASVIAPSLALGVLVFVAIDQIQRAIGAHHTCILDELAHWLRPEGTPA